MPCGKRPLVKKWDKPKFIRVITPSRYEQNEASVKVHWKKVIRDLELSYKDDQFWETQRDSVQELVGPTIFRRLAQMFNLPPDDNHYEPPPDSISMQASTQFYIQRTSERGAVCAPKTSIYSVSDMVPSEEEETTEEEEESEWGMSSEVLDNLGSKIRSMTKSKSTTSKILMSKYNISRVSTARSLTWNRSLSRSKKFSNAPISLDSLACTDDDLIVQDSKKNSREEKIFKLKSGNNPHFDMLYCNESETDMIKWNSKYKQKAFEVSASDEFSKRAEILTKKIAIDFYEWWVSLGNVEFKSEIKRPEDIENLFQVLFDEHASRSLVLDPKILPCVLPSIAKYVGIPKASCPSVLKRQIAYDIDAETSPAHKEAFGTCLPQRMKHIPPNNDTKKMWHSLVIPEDLKTMSAVWGEISHLTSTKAFHAWLQKRPHLPMAKYLQSLDSPATDKKQAFVVPSDYVLTKEGSGVASNQDLALPVSEFTLELKEVLQQIMND